MILQQPYQQYFWPINTKHQWPPHLVQKWTFFLFGQLFCFYLTIGRSRFGSASADILIFLNIIFLLHLEHSFVQFIFDYVLQSNCYHTILSFPLVWSFYQRLFFFAIQKLSSFPKLFLNYVSSISISNYLMPKSFQHISSSIWKLMIQ